MTKFQIQMIKCEAVPWGKGICKYVNKILRASSTITCRPQYDRIEKPIVLIILLKKQR